MVVDEDGAEAVFFAELCSLDYTLEGFVGRVYTLVSENDRWVVVVLEMFLTHKEYGKRFGYC